MRDDELRMDYYEEIQLAKEEEEFRQKYGKKEDDDNFSERELKISLLKNEFLNLKRLININNEQIRDEYKKLEKEIDYKMEQKNKLECRLEHANYIEKQESNDIYENINAYIKEISFINRKKNGVLDLEKYIYQSIVLTAYSILENEINKYCKECKHRFKLSIGLNDLNHNGVFRAVKYLDKVVIMEEEIMSNCKWGKIRNINDLRNDLMHYNGKLSAKKEELGLSEEKVQKTIDKYRRELKVRFSGSNILITYNSALYIIQCIEEFLEFILKLGYKDKRRKF